MIAMICGSDLRQARKSKAHHDDTAAKACLGPLTSLVSRKEEKSSEHDRLDVETNEDGAEGSAVELATGLEVVGLVGRPGEGVLPSGVKDKHGEPGE